METAFLWILGIFVRFLIKCFGFYGKTDKRKIETIVSMDRGRPAGSVKTNNILEIETCADEN